MPTLLQINSTCNSGSTGRIAEQISLLAQSKGWDCYIAHGNRGNNPSKVHNIPVVSPFEEKIHGVYTRLFDMHGLASKRATLRLIDTMKDIHPDIVHLHNIHGYYLNYEVLFRYLASVDVPIVWTLHDCWSFTGHCAHFDYVGCEKWKYGCSACPQINSYPKSLFVDNSKNNYLRKKASFTSVKNMTIVPVSEWLAEKARQSFLGERNILVIPNGVDVQTFKPSPSIEIRNKYGIGNGRFLLAVASVWSERKGLKDYIRLALLLGENVRLVLVGLSLKQAKNLPRNIIAVPRTQDVVELAQLYTEASVVLNLSYEETFGLTTVEGYACGTPAIVYDRTASPELVVDGTGLVVRAGDINEVYTAINTILNNGKSQYSSRCRSLAEDKYDKEKSFQSYIDLYDSLLVGCWGGVITYVTICYKLHPLRAYNRRVAA